MVKVYFERSEDGKSLILHIEGHAGQAEFGQDIVCASASILAYTVAQVIKTMGEQGKLRKKPVIKLENGDAVITCKPKTAHFAEALHTYSVANVGYQLLAHNYPDFVQLYSFGRAGKL